MDETPSKIRQIATPRRLPELGRGVVLHAVEGVRPPGAGGSAASAAAAATGRV